MPWQDTEALGTALTVPAEDIAQAVPALGNGLMMQHVLAPSDRTATAYRWALRAIFSEAARSPEGELQ
jgi:hypothetical protein